MIIDKLITRTEGNICIHTATEADRDDYISMELDGEWMKSFLKVSAAREIDVCEIIWKERYESDCIMFAIVECSSEKTVGFCEIEHIASSEPTIGIMLTEAYRGKGYGYLAAKMMIEEGWKLFDHPYFIWEVEQDNIASKKLVLKLGGELFNKRCVLPDHVVNVMREKGIEINQEDFPNSVERYKIERPK